MDRRNRGRRAFLVVNIHMRNSNAVRAREREGQHHVLA